MVRLRVKELLDKRGKSVYWLAAELGMARSAVYRLVRGVSSGIDFATIDRLCGVLECKPGDLFEREVPQARGAGAGVDILGREVKPVERKPRAKAAGKGAKK